MEQTPNSKLIYDYVKAGSLNGLRRRMAMKQTEMGSFLDFQIYFDGKEHIGWYRSPIEKSDLVKEEASALTR